VLQTLSPYNKGLIRRAISQSGVALSPWVIQKNPLSWAEEVCGGGRGGQWRGQGWAAEGVCLGPGGDFFVLILYPGSCICPQIVL
jgi:hypothetical protein